MAVGWFLAPYKRRDLGARRARYCAMDDFTAQVRADGGDWSETEVLGQHAIVKVRADALTLAAIAAVPGITRLPVDRLDDLLSSLTVNQRNALRGRITALGYTVAELDAALPGDLRTRTLRQVLQFVASQRRKVRYDPGTDAIIDDGEPVTPRPLDDVDDAVPVIAIPG